MTQETSPTNPVRAIALLSGGLDSMLAAKLVLERGIEVIGISFESPFFNADRARKAAIQLGIPLITWDITDELNQVQKNPKHGYGRFFNPCIDCHALMVKKALELLPSLQAQFIITGEVLHQRPKSQKMHGLMAVAKDSGAQDLILRPLSAKLLPPTKPEKEGWVDRSQLLDIQGRSRQRQLELAQELGITDYPMPAGGCLLTDMSVSRRLQRIFEYWKEDIDGPFLELSKVGRHFWAGNHLIVVARNEQESYHLRSLIKAWDYKVELLDIPGPTTLVRCHDQPTADILELAAMLTARYSKARTMPSVEVKAENYLFLQVKTLQVEPSALAEAMEHMRVEQL